jgi:hypothetical protein
MRALVMAATGVVVLTAQMLTGQPGASRDTNQSSLTDADYVAIQQLVAGAYALDTAADRG